MIALPDWERGTPGVLCVDGPHAIPVSTLVRGGDDRLLLALGRRRETLDRLRGDPEAAVCLLGRGMAFTAYGRAEVVRDPMEAADHVAAVALGVHRVQDHLADELTDMVDGARWRWRSDRAREEEPGILAELERLGAVEAGGAA